MNREDVRDYCLSKSGAVEDFPFGADVAVIKVRDKMFALIPVGDAQISLKCDPEWAVVLRQTFTAVQPGYHLNKRHWNTVTLDGTIPDDQVCELIDHSYDLVVKSLPKAVRNTLK
jgi:predicted DNA-binding protein (MmcQ/YjbR family)